MEQFLHAVQGADVHRRIAASRKNTAVTVDGVVDGGDEPLDTPVRIFSANLAAATKVPLGQQSGLPQVDIDNLEKLMLVLEQEQNGRIRRELCSYRFVASQRGVVRLVQFVAFESFGGEERVVGVGETRECDLLREDTACPQNAVAGKLLFRCEDPDALLVFTEDFGVVE